MIDVHRLVGDLEAGASHSKVLTIHVDLSWYWLIICIFRHVSLNILVERNLNINFFSSSLIN